MDIVFLNFVVMLFFYNMVSSAKEDCKRYFPEHNVQIKDGCSKEIKLEYEIHSVQCTEYCENDHKCTAVVADNSYKTKTCCLLYDNPVIMATGTGTGNQALYYKPTTTVLPKKDGADAGSKHDYIIYTETLCNENSFEPDGPFPNQIDDVEQCKTWCSSASYCNSFSYYEEYRKCFFHYTKCETGILEQNNKATTYIKN